jgi:hypothetical protein
MPAPAGKKKSTPGEVVFGFIILALIVGGVSKCGAGSEGGSSHQNPGTTQQQRCDQLPDQTARDFCNGIDTSLLTGAP